MLTSYLFVTCYYHPLLLSSNVLASELSKQIFESIYFFIRRCFHTDEDSATLDTGFVNFCPILRNACSDQGANQSARRATCAGAG
jgi:hypothetical protein